MATRDMVHSVKPTAGLAPAVRTATALSAACDTQGFEAVTVLVHLGTFGDVQSGTLYIEAELQESSDNSTYTAVADSDLLILTSRSTITGTATGTFVQTKTTGNADTAGLYSVGYRGSKRYLKVNMRLTGTHSTGTPSAVAFVAGHPDYVPAQ